jgi:hypothetical protein
VAWQIAGTGDFSGDGRDDNLDQLSRFGAGIWHSIADKERAQP